MVGGGAEYAPLTKGVCNGTGTVRDDTEVRAFNSFISRSRK